MCRSRDSSTDFKNVASVTTLQNPDLSLERKKALIAGAPFDAAGRSTSSMAYSFFTEQDGNAWVFNYHPFYAWNGCSNQAFAAPIFGSVFDVSEYYLCPIGVHEFDLEHVGVYICPADLEAGQRGANPRGRPLRPTPAATRQSIRRVQYSQHSWLDEFNCEDGECPFEDSALSASKLVAYSGLFSHAMYPRASSLWVRPFIHCHFMHGTHACVHGVLVTATSCHPNLTEVWDNWVWNTGITVMIGRIACNRSGGNLGMHPVASATCTCPSEGTRFIP